MTIGTNTNKSNSDTQNGEVISFPDDRVGERNLERLCEQDPDVAAGLVRFFDYVDARPVEARVIDGLEAIKHEQIKRYDYFKYLESQGETTEPVTPYEESPAYKKAQERIDQLNSPRKVIDTPAGPMQLDGIDCVFYTEDGFVGAKLTPLEPNPDGYRDFLIFLPIKELAAFTPDELPLFGLKYDKTHDEGFVGVRGTWYTGYWDIVEFPHNNTADTKPTGMSVFMPYRDFEGPFALVDKSSGNKSKVHSIVPNWLGEAWQLDSPEAAKYYGSVVMRLAA